MKKYLLLLSLFFSLSVWGQARYKIELNNLTCSISPGISFSKLTITLIYDDNSTVQLYYKYFDSQTCCVSGWTLNPPIYSVKTPKIVRTTYDVGYTDGHTDYVEYNDSTYLCPEIPHVMSIPMPTTFFSKVTPIFGNILVQPLDNAFPTDDSIDIIMTAHGFPQSVYNWEFSWDLINWHSFQAQYQGVEFMSLTATELLAGSGFNVNDSIEKNIHVRLSACSNDNVVSNSNVITYVIKKSPPNITNITATPPRCFDTNDGKVKFTFDRALVTGESLILSLKDSTHPGLIYFRQITNDSLDAAHAYTFPDNLQPAQYYLVYQGKYTYVDNTGTTIVSQSNIKQSSLFDVVAPIPVAFTTTHVNVWCYNGNDGTITINATGGMGNYQYMIKRSGQPDSVWYNFSAANQHTITGLTANTWLLQIRDGNQCYAKTAAGGTIITQTIVITQPSSPLQNNLVALINPTAFGLSDGSIEVEITGGTPRPDGSYNFQWTTLAGTPINTGITTTVTGTGYDIKLANLPDGTYILNTNDNNYSSATATGGCTDIDTFIVRQPLPLKVKIEIQDSILCKGDNNGSLVAHGEGGVKFTSGNPYIYTWKMQNASGAYIVLSSQTDSIATGLTTGWYAVNIKDANGIVLAQDSTFFLPEPTLLTVGITHVNVTCAGLPNGSATAYPSGGTPPYSYSWNTGDSTATINNLVAGTYLVFIKDYHHCQTQQNVVIAQPNAMVLTITKKQPVCFNSCDGQLTANLTGGTAPFTYQWIGSSSVNNVAANLCSGNYQVTITDANGCSIVQKDTLLNPAPLPLSLGADRYLCANQSIGYDITIPNTTGIIYQWSSTTGFTSNQPKVVLTQAGTYYASVTDANGCNSKDTVTLMASGTAISNEFALPTQAFVNEQIVVVNTTNPPADSVQWVFPAQANITEQTANFATFNIADTGAYYLKFITYRGMCYAEQTKKVIVSNRTGLNSIGTTRNPFIKVFTVAPNPNNGTFTVRVTLQDKAAIQLKLINVLTNQVSSLSYQSGSDSYVLPFNVSVIAGTYVLLLETPKGTATMKVVIL